MMAAAFTNQHERMRRSLSNAIEGCLYESCHEEGPSVLVLEARRPEGQHVAVRFLGLQQWQGTREPDPGTPLRLLGVGSSLSGLRLILAMVNPFARPPIVMSSRVRIEAGGARLDIECQDIEWWQDEAAPDGSSVQT
jgi:hypothetical protein